MPSEPKAEIAKPLLESNSHSPNSELTQTPLRSDLTPSLDSAVSAPTTFPPRSDLGPTPTSPESDFSPPPPPPGSEFSPPPPPPGSDFSPPPPPPGNFGPPPPPGPGGPPPPPGMGIKTMRDKLLTI